MLALLFLSASALVFTAGATDCQDGNAAMTAIVMSVETACGGGDVCLDVDACETAIKGISASAFADIKTDLATCTTDEEKNAYVESMLMVVINAYKCGVQSALTTVTGSDAASEAVAGAVAYADLLIDSCVADCRENDDDVRRRRETLTLSNSNEEGPSGSSGSSGSEDVSGTGSHDDSEGCGFPYNDCELAECTTDQAEYGVACKASSKCVDAVDALLADQNALEGIAEFIAMEDDDHSRQRRAGHLAEVTSTLNDLKTLCTPSDSTPSDGETTTVSPTGTVGGGAADMVSSLTLLLATSVIVALL